MRKFYTLTIFLFTLLAASTSSAQEFFDDQAGWLAAITGTVVEDDFSQFGETNGIVDLGDPIDFEFGQLSSPNSDVGAFYLNEGDGGIFVNFSTVDLLLMSPASISEYVITPDTTTHGDLEGFCLCYGTVNSTDVTVEVFDGTNLVSTLTLPGTPNNDASINYCWINDTGATITSFNVIFGEEFGGICDIDLAFTAPVVDDSCRSLIQDLIVDLESLLPTGSQSDDYFIQEALLDLNAMNSDAIFDDDDLLNEIGCYFFFRAQWGVYFLQCVHNSDVSAQIDAFNAIVQCVTQAAIDEAISRGGDQSFIDYAIELEDFAQYLEDCGYYLDAIYYRKFAWYYAFCS